jgi:hypothetical protein
MGRGPAGDILAVMIERQPLQACEGANNKTRLCAETLSFACGLPISALVGTLSYLVARAPYARKRRTDGSTPFCSNRPLVAKRDRWVFFPDTRRNG